MIGSINVGCEELSRLCPKVFTAIASFSGNLECWSFWVEIREWGGRCGSWAEHFASLDDNGCYVGEESDDELTFELELSSRQFSGTHLDGYGMCSCEKSLRDLLDELNRIDCDVLLRALKEHLST